MRSKKRYKIKARKNNFSKEREDGFKIVYSRNKRNDVELKNLKIKNSSSDEVKKKEVPWITNKTIESSGVLKLHNEILDFYHFIKPKEDETQKRLNTINLLKKLINDKWPHWKIKIFGSFPNDLHLPNSDIDVVVFKQESISLKTLYNFANDSILTDTAQLQLIYRELLMKNFVSEIRYVDAKVPIIKAVCKNTGVNFDISVNRKNGYQAMKIIRNITQDYPFIRPIILLLKFFLRQRDLNETFTGGVSSYLLFNMIYAYVQYLIRDNKNSQGKLENINLGSFLIGFLKFYGYEFNYTELGISIRDGGRFFRKFDRNFAFNDNLCFENFQDVSIDIGRAAYQFPRIRDLFQDILCKFYKKKWNSESYLKHMIIVTSELRKMEVHEIEDLLVKESNLLQILNTKDQIISNDF